MSRLPSRRGTKYECALYEARASAPYIVGEHDPSCLRSDLIARCDISATSRVEPDFDSTRRRSPVSSSHSLIPRSPMPRGRSHCPSLCVLAPGRSVCGVETEHHLNSPRWTVTINAASARAKSIPIMAWLRFRSAYIARERSNVRIGLRISMIHTNEVYDSVETR
jgi:hypothetical protein